MATCIGNDFRRTARHRITWITPQRADHSDLCGRSERHIRLWHAGLANDLFLFESTIRAGKPRPYKTFVYFVSLGFKFRAVIK